MSETIVAYQSFVGVDLHKETVTLTAVNPRGEVLARLKISTKSVGKIEAWLRALPRPCQMAVEAVGFVEWFIDRFSGCVDRIDIADATELANRRGKRRKNDPNADTLEFWAGLTADLKESAGRTQSGNITKAGSVALRWAICQAALTLCHSDAKQESTRQKLIKRIGNAKANVAMGRRLLCILYAMVRDGKRYEGGPRRDRTSAANKAKRLRKQRKGAA